jgi:hypothetical protein
MTNEALGIMRKDDAAWKILRNYKARFVKLIINIHKLQLLYFFWGQIRPQTSGIYSFIGFTVPGVYPKKLRSIYDRSGSFLVKHDF